MGLFADIYAGCTDPSVDTSGVLTIQCIIPLLQSVVNFAFLLVGVTALFFIIFSGLKFLYSGGDPKQIESARNTLTYAVIGLLVVLFSFVIIDTISFITGAYCITIPSLDIGSNKCR